MASVIVFTNGGAEAALLSVARGSGLLGSRLRPANLARMRRAMDPKLRAAIDDSYYLLLFCSRAQIEPTSKNQESFDKAVRTITMTQTKVENGDELAAEEQNGFWSAFIELSNVCFPASIESIRYSFDARASRRQRASLWFVALAFFLLIVTIFSSLAWIIGQTTLEQYVSDYAQYSAIANLSRFHDEGRALQGTFDDKTKRLLVSTEQFAPSVVDVSSDQIGSVLQLFPGLLRQGTRRKDIPPRPAEARDEAPGSAAAGSPPPRPDADSKELAETEHRLDEEIDVGYLCSIGRNSLAWRVFCSCNAELKVKRRHLLIADQLVAHYTNLDTDRRTLLMLTGPFEAASRVLAFLHLIPSDAAAQKPAGGGSPPGEPTCIRFGAPPPGLPSQSVALQSQGGPADRRSETTTGGCGTCNAGPTPAGEHTYNASGQTNQTVNPPRFGQDLREALLIYVGLLKIGRPIPVLPPPPLESLAAVQLKAHLALSVLSKYVLPLLFGLLGASVHVIREINARSESFTLVPSALRRYWARIVLGAVAGPFIGLFFDSSGRVLTVGADTTAGPALSSQLSPLAMAFLAGFSVEILFSILDRLIRVFKDFASTDNPGPVRR